MTDDDIHPMQCPSCGETIKPTNVEYVYPPTDDTSYGRILSAADRSRLHSCPLGHDIPPLHDREQLYVCPNDDCRIVRLHPGDRS